MNLMALSFGETLVVVDAGVTFPESELLGVDLITPDLTYLQEHRHRSRAGSHARARGPHRGRALPPAARPRSGLWHAAHACDGGAEARRARARGQGSAEHREAARRRDGRPFQDRVPARHAQHAGLRGGGDSHAGRHRSSTPATSRSIRRRSTASSSTSIASPSSDAQGVLALFADSTNIDRHGFSGSELEVVDAFEEIFTATQGKIVVAMFSSSIYRMQVLVDLAAQFDAQVAFVGRGVRRIRRSRSSSATCASRPACRFATATSAPTPAATSSASPPARRASRWRRCRGSRSTITGTSSSGRRHGRVLRARDSRQRTRYRPRDESHRAARRGRRSMKA